MPAETVQAAPAAPATAGVLDDLRDVQTVLELRAHALEELLQRQGGRMPPDEVEALTWTMHALSARLARIAAALH